jgi:hypothetical protein
MYKHVLISDTKIWEATIASWPNEAKKLGDEGVFLSLDIETKLKCLKQQVEKEENFHCYFLVKTGSICASALLEISHALPKAEDSWVKLLNITLQPSLLPMSAGVSAEIFKEAVTVLAFSITHAISLIFEEHKAKTLKIYCRTNEMQELVKVLVSTDKLEMATDSYQLSARLEGKWLIIERV